MIDAVDTAGDQEERMISRGSTLLGTVLAVGAVVLLSGCGSSTGGDAKPVSTSASADASVAADAPTGYAPCNDVPQSVLDSEKLGMKIVANNDASGGVAWRGCRWVRPNGYSVSIRTTNLTVDLIRSRNFPEATEFTINGRRAISTRQFDGPFIKEACTVDVEMKGGSLEFNLNNPPSNRDTGSMDSCVLARELAEKVVPSLPATA
ncbi:DUF3558 domain-containing protein [Nocardia pseudovaccinii]|uniref:DUF3558 domain-containing protein n=1 Tax=Nocardia pseudovaccinii TaxID=189540 RepID=UPI0007A3BE86|nr:DUF3558 domain-containing protein [Nocardia pseudovaccinii]